MKGDSNDRLRQAGDYLEEARALLDAGMDLKFVANNLYYAMLYPVLALLESDGIPTGAQSVSISLFEKEFVAKGVFGSEMSDALRRAFELRPACACDAPKDVTKQDMEDLLPSAETFIEAVERHLNKK
jgi:uncharacterized protein (UPF0332 family)